jgi:hypothetical protein
MPLLVSCKKTVFRSGATESRDPLATPIVARMDELFAVDAEARRKALSVTARHVQRQETAKPLLDDIRSKIEAPLSVALPSSALSKACKYGSRFGGNLHDFWNIRNLS